MTRENNWNPRANGWNPRAIATWCWTHASWVDYDEKECAWIRVAKAKGRSRLAACRTEVYALTTRQDGSLTPMMGEDVDVSA